MLPAALAQTVGNRFYLAAPVQIAAGGVEMKRHHAEARGAVAGAELGEQSVLRPCLAAGDVELLEPFQRRQRRQLDHRRARTSHALVVEHEGEPWPLVAHHCVARTE